jgi:hypothetical protein
MDAVTLERAVAHADGDQHRYEPASLATRVVVLQVSDISAHLVHIGLLDLDAVFELDNEDRPILQHDQIRTSAATSGQLEFQD